MPFSGDKISNYTFSDHQYSLAYLTTDYFRVLSYSLYYHHHKNGRRLGFYLPYGISMTWFLILGEVTKISAFLPKNLFFCKIIKNDLKRCLNHPKMTVDLLNGTHGQYKNTKFHQYRQLLSIFFCLCKNVTGENWGLRLGFFLNVKKNTIFKLKKIKKSFYTSC